MKGAAEMSAGKKNRPEITDGPLVYGSTFARGGGNFKKRNLDQNAIGVSYTVFR